MPGQGGLNFVDLMLKLARERGRVRVVDDEGGHADIHLTACEANSDSKPVRCLRTVPRDCGRRKCLRTNFSGDLRYQTHVRLRSQLGRGFRPRLQRPSYAALENHALKKRHLNVFTTWQEGLRDHLGVCEPCSVPTAIPHLDAQTCKPTKS